ncbi:hypothetical protein MY8738_001041 [Beauveria namnaoensis]
MPHTSRKLQAKLAVDEQSGHDLFASEPEVICSDRCSSCGLVGEYIFLLTCERACLSCVFDTTSFQVIEKSLAESIFQLNSDKIAAAPAYYCAQRKLSFVRTDEMKEIAAMANAPTSLFAALGLDKLFIVYCSQRISSTIIFIPSPSEAWPEGGRRCGGCVKDSQLTLISHFDPRSPHLDSGQEILYKAMRHYSQAEFWDHIEHFHDPASTENRGVGPRPEPVRATKTPIALTRRETPGLPAEAVKAAEASNATAAAAAAASRLEASIGSHLDQASADSILLHKENKQ